LPIWVGAPARSGPPGGEKHTEGWGSWQEVAWQVTHDAMTEPGQDGFRVRTDRFVRVARSEVACDQRQRPSAVR
jgi:hypothetical protein